MTVRVTLPLHLRMLADVAEDVQLEVAEPVSIASVLAALEARCPNLRGTIREHDTQRRRPRLRFFAAGKDVTHQSPDAPLPDAVATGSEPFMIVGAIAGG